MGTGQPVPILLTAFTQKGKPMSDTLSFDDLKTRVKEGTIDTVLVCLVDMQGRLMGKRFHAQNFIEHSYEETQLLQLPAGPRIWKWQHRTGMHQPVGSPATAIM